MTKFSKLELKMESTISQAPLIRFFFEYLLRKFETERAKLRYPDGVDS
jgi:hypothetical protein